MIQIVESEAKKVPGETSLYVSFNYKEEYINILKNCPGSNYSKKDKCWEVPLTYLSTLLDGLIPFEDIDLSILESKPPFKPKQFELGDYKVTPFPHQIEAIQYGLNHKKWMLLDAPGLGKSLSLILLAKELKERKKIDKCLIVCGINSLKSNWRKEIQKFTDLSCIILGEKINRKGKRYIGSIPERVAQLKNPIEEFFVITNIETLRSDDVVKAILKGPNKFGMLAFDESHMARNSESSQAKGLLKLKDIEYIIPATGTPIVSSPLNAYVPLKLLGVDKSTLTNFKYYYCTFGGPFNNIICGFKNMDILKDTINKYSLRRSKELLNLPPRIIINEYVDMDEDQDLLYENVKKGIRESVDKVKLNTSSLLALMTRLRQVTGCPSVLTTEKVSCAKIERAIQLTEEVIENKGKIVLFCNFKETVIQLAERLKSYNPLIATGETPDDEVSQNVDKFQNDSKYKVFIGTWQKMGTGITLTSAETAVFVDYAMTFSQWEQAADRIYRIGTKNTVTIYNLITTDTIDERIMEIIEMKEAIGDYLVDGEISENGLQILQKYIEDL